MTNPDFIDGLNHLIEVCRDGELGYAAAADAVSNSSLHTVFEEYSKQRAGFVRALEAEVIRLGGQPAESSSLTAALHRGWMSVKSAVTGGDAGAIVAACETGEDFASAAFEAAADSAVTGQTRALIEKQWHAIQEAHRRLLRLKEEIASGVEYPHNE